MKTATFLITLSFFLSVSCTSNAGLGEPPKLFYGEDVCDECGMIISDRRFASGYTTKQGISRKFDDIGGMSVFLKKYPEEVYAYGSMIMETKTGLKLMKPILLYQEISLPRWGTG